MNQTERINKLLEMENINLMEFKDLTGINYDSLLRYRNNRSPISVKAISKICSIPRFAKYRELLLSIDQGIEDVIPSTGRTSELSGNAYEARDLLKQLEETGRLEEAMEIMKTLLKRAEKQ